MPFTFEPKEVCREKNELVLRGRIVAGAYFGPESIVLRSTTGAELPSYIHTHGMQHPEGWPVLPEHEKSILILYIPVPPADFEVALVTGLGTLASARERIDVTHLLEAPEFWALQAGGRAASEEVEEPEVEWFGLPQKVVGEWYDVNIDSHLRNGRFPYVRIPLLDSRYVEMETAAGVEYQDRVWIGRIGKPERVLLGYHSGHFSLPAFRTEEVSWVAAQTDFSASALLWLTATYRHAGDAPLAWVETCASRVPGLIPGKEVALAKGFLGGTTRELVWTVDSLLGWVNNSPYSQRNPKSALSILKPADFAYIREFFG